MQEQLRWDDVRVFLALARGRNLSRAASDLGVDASTVSRRLAALEHDLGTRLFDRTPEGLVATVATERLLASAEDAEASMLRFARATEGFEAEARGVVRISAPPGIAADFVAGKLARLLERHPALRIELDSSIGLVDLTRREADLAIRTVRPQAGDLVMTRLATARYTVLASPDYRDVAGRVGDWSELRWIGWTAPLAHIPAAAWLAKHAPAAEPVLRSSSLAVQVAAAESGLGAVLLTEEYCALKDLVPMNATAALLARTEWPEEAVWLVGHRALRDVPRIAAVWNFIVEGLERDQALAAERLRPAARRKKR